MGCKQLTGRADGGGAANAGVSVGADANANSLGPALEAPYAFYVPGHIANVVKRARVLVSDAAHALGLRDESKGVLLAAASEHLAFLDEVMTDSLPVLGEFRRRFSRCACGCETSGRSDMPQAGKQGPKPKAKPKATATAKAKGD